MPGLEPLPVKACPSDAGRTRGGRLETEVVGITGLTTSDRYVAPAHGRQQHRRDFQANPISAVVVRRWHNRDDRPAGKTVVLTRQQLLAKYRLTAQG
jgi:hypothetical protein